MIGWYRSIGRRLLAATLAAFSLALLMGCVLPGLGVAVHVTFTEQEPIPVRMYIVSGPGNSIVTARLNGTDASHLPPMGVLDEPYAIALDLDHSRMFVTNINSSTVAVANLDGSSPNSLGNPGGFLDSPQGIALDVPNGKMYIANRDTHNVVVANLDGSDPVDLGNPGGLLSFPYGIALDLAEQKMYIASVNNHRVVVADLDGGNATSLALGGLINGPSNIALDLAEGEMYVVSAFNQDVVVADLDGANPLSLKQPGWPLHHPEGIALDLVNRRMYVTSWEVAGVIEHYVMRADLDGGNAVDYGDLGGVLDGHGGVAINQ